MQNRLSNSVRAFLPLAVLAFCHGCGGGGSGSGTQSAGGTSPPETPLASNHAPTITADTNAYARVGATFEYLPTSHDSDGDRLTFTAENLPPWASIDSKSGKISGMPGPSDVGAYEEITILVADAGHRISTPPFSITVLGPATGLATLHWELPPAKVDGSPLDDLAGYRIVYGRRADDLDNSVFISDPSQTSFEFTTLTEGIWYFAVIAVNANGLEGPPTTPAMKSI